LAILAEFHVLAELKSVDEELNALESHMQIDGAALPDRCYDAAVTGGFGGPNSHMRGSHHQLVLHE
jgi:hypothetical protein